MLDAALNVARRNAHADAVRAPRLRDAVNGFKKETGPVRERSAVFISALVRVVTEELLGQVTVRPVKLDAIESRYLGKLRSAREVSDDGFDFPDLQSARDGNRLGAVFRVGFPSRGKSGRRYRKGSAGLEILVGLATDMPELEKDSATGLVHAFRNEFPAFGLLLGVNARRAIIPVAGDGNRRRFADDQPGFRSLSIVFGVQAPRNVTRHARPHPGERSHDDTVWELK